MTYIAKPRLHHPTLTANKVGYTRRDYEGRISTRIALPSFRASVAVPRRRIIFSVPRTVSTPCMGACRRH
jgi:hypothetical protein